MDKIEKILLDTPNYRIIESCYVGFYPRFDLYEKRKFLFFSWWSFIGWSMTLDRAYEVMKKRMKYLK